MTGGPVAYDTSVLIAAERDDRAVWLQHLAALRCEIAPVVPAPVLAQAWRGGPQPLLSRLLGGCQVVSMDEEVARAAGTACGRAGTGRRGGPLGLGTDVEVGAPARAARRDGPGALGDLALRLAEAGVQEAVDAEAG